MKTKLMPFFIKHREQREEGDYSLIGAITFISLCHCTSVPFATFHSPTICKQGLSQQKTVVFLE